METKQESPLVARAQPKTDEIIKSAPPTPTNSITIQNISQPFTQVLKLDSPQPSRSPDTNSTSDVVSQRKESKSVEEIVEATTACMINCYKFLEQAKFQNALDNVRQAIALFGILFIYFIFLFLNCEILL